MRIKYRVFSTIGKRKENQDSYLIKKVGNFYIFAVADGMGGGVSGKEASKIAIDLLKKINLIDKNYLLESLKSMIREINLKLRNFLNGVKGGTTLTILILDIKNMKGYFLNVGDSRLSLVRNGVLSSITIDQNRFFRKIIKNEIPEEDDKRLLVYFLGKEFDLNELFIDDKWHSIGEIKLKNGDYLMLSTDGFHDILDSEINENKFFDLENIDDLGKILKRAVDNATLITIKLIGEKK